MLKLEALLSIKSNPPVVYVNINGYRSHFEASKKHFYTNLVQKLFLIEFIIFLRNVK